MELTRYQVLAAMLPEVVISAKDRRFADEAFFLWYGKTEPDFNETPEGNKSDNEEENCLPSTSFSPATTTPPPADTENNEVGQSQKESQPSDNEDDQTSLESTGFFPDITPAPPDDEDEEYDAEDEDEDWHLYISDSEEENFNSQQTRSENVSQNIDSVQVNTESNGENYDPEHISSETISSETIGSETISSETTSSETTIDSIQVNTESVNQNSDPEHISSETISSETISQTSDSVQVNAESKGKNSGPEHISSETISQTNDSVQVNEESNGENSDPEHISSETVSQNIDSVQVNSESNGENSDPEHISSETVSQTNDSVQVNKDSNGKNSGPEHISSETVSLNIDSVQVNAESNSDNSDPEHISSETVSSENITQNSDSVQVNSESNGENSDPEHISSESVSQNFETDANDRLEENPYAGDDCMLIELEDVSSETSKQKQSSQIAIVPSATPGSHSNVSTTTFLRNIQRERLVKSETTQMKYNFRTKIPPSIRLRWDDESVLGSDEDNSRPIKLKKKPAITLGTDDSSEMSVAEKSKPKTSNNQSEGEGVVKDPSTEINASKSADKEIGNLIERKKRRKSHSGVVSDSPPPKVSRCHKKHSGRKSKGITETRPKPISGNFTDFSDSDDFVPIGPSTSSFQHKSFQKANLDRGIATAAASTSSTGTKRATMSGVQMRPSRFSKSYREFFDQSDESDVDIGKSFKSSAVQGARSEAITSQLVIESETNFLSIKITEEPKPESSSKRKKPKDPTSNKLKRNKLSKDRKTKQSATFDKDKPHSEEVHPEPHRANEPMDQEASLVDQNKPAKRINRSPLEMKIPLDEFVTPENSAKSVSDDSDSNSKKAKIIGTSKGFLIKKLPFGMFSIGNRAKRQNQQPQETRPIQEEDNANVIFPTDLNCDSCDFMTDDISTLDAHHESHRPRWELPRGGDRVGCSQFRFSDVGDVTEPNLTVIENEQTKNSGFDSSNSMEDNQTESVQNLDDSGSNRAPDCADESILDQEEGESNLDPECGDGSNFDPYDYESIHDDEMSNEPVIVDPTVFNSSSNDCDSSASQAEAKTVSTKNATQSGASDVSSEGACQLTGPDEDSAPASSAEEVPTVGPADSNSNKENVSQPCTSSTVAQAEALLNLVPQCNSCLTPSVRSLRQRAESIPAKDQVFKCSSCSFETTRPDELIDHCLLNHLRVSFGCSICDFVGKTKIEMMHHYKAKHIDQP